jgi:hypothetical protein
MAYGEPRSQPMGGRAASGYCRFIHNKGGQLMSFALYVIGLAILLGGIAWALVAAHVATTYVAIVCLIVAGIGVMMAVSRTRLKDPPN